MKSVLILAAAMAAAPFVADAQTATTSVKAATTTKTTTTTSKPTLGASKATVNKTKNTTATTADAKGNLAVHKTSTGKTITYDCSKAGNKNKAACKGK